MLAQFVEDLLHLVGRDDRLDQHRGLDRAAWQAERVLRGDEDVVPQARLEMALHLRQVEVRAAAALDELVRVVRHEHREVEQAAAHALAVDRHVLLVEVPAARAHHQRRDLVVQRVLPAVVAGQADGAPDRVDQVDLAVDLVGPVRRVAVLEVRHVAVGPRVQRVDDHLAVDRPGDLDAAALQVGRQRRDGPVTLAHLARLGQEVELPAGIERTGELDARREQFAAARLEPAVQHRDQRERLRAQHRLLGRRDGSGDLQAGGGLEGHGDLTRPVFRPSR